MSLPDPEPGLVINYSYLWLAEQETGAVEGRKNRPAVIVLATRVINARTVVTVVPITHSPPKNAADAVAIPSAVKAHLKLDDQPSWIVTREGNEFVWPGFDVRFRPGLGRVDYGFVPPALFQQVYSSFMAHTLAGRTRRIDRN